MTSFCRKIVHSFLGLNDSSNEFYRTLGERPWQSWDVPSLGHGLSLIAMPDKVPNVLQYSAAKYAANSAASIAIKKVPEEVGYTDGDRRDVDDDEASGPVTWTSRMAQMKNQVKLQQPLELWNKDGQPKTFFLGTLKKNQRWSIQQMSHRAAFLSAKIDGVSTPTALKKVPGEMGWFIEASDATPISADLSNCHGCHETCGTRNVEMNNQMMLPLSFVVV
ncbi:hypothetical protein Nepgr_005837 [Nepenthes gracilis]|uniref:Uncharacterized protein n=1 Tax=Nepenthes gracilis TaxID=150966 RepID=A0AAD3S422_NEPGR|nr:hypothetical protein Nepgr_005837 [Nepenthes gracilis]